ncbi:uncharacterized protein DUF4047 [Scopulibacillus darangshiensis]|uniref:Uncharacterized protein DUF4047 n=1 Tax=Scopulibacillus darangshiensis TaxID=442528 RepID=A0A4R2P3G7_9BACL|nr:DUF4047 domain-containing protein [Scopulibacillus darangshiensis]TCP29222.1 uncharacterized protein DUF4047 [Scopulibacillus darangshiensis]
MTKQSKKSSKPINKRVILLCLCSITFYFSSQVMGKTKAMFSDQEKSITTMSAAAVFPDTVAKLVERARDLSADLANTHVNKANRNLVDLTRKEAKAMLTKCQTRRKDIKEKRKELQAILDELEEYLKLTNAATSNKKAVDDSFDYLRTGLNEVQKLNDKIDQKDILKRMDEDMTELKEKIKGGG